MLQRSLKRKDAPTRTDEYTLRRNNSPGRLRLLDDFPTNTTTTTIFNSAIMQTERVYEWPPFQNLEQVFPEYICGAIQTHIVKIDGVPHSKASVTMVFLSEGLHDCLMSFGVRASEVKRLAKDLFDIRVESSADNIRYIHIEGGVRLLPHPEILLKGALQDKIIKVLGQKVHEAVAACCMREKEIEEGIAVTDCVSMQFTSKPSESATLNLALGMEEGTQIRKKLYTRM